jgi:type IV pilus assembly protein PilX
MTNRPSPVLHCPMYKLPATAARRQRGATLIITLVMLVLVTLVGVASIRTSTMDERMAGNSRDREKALQAAESVVLKCLGQIQNSLYTGTPLVPAAAGATPHWETAWTNANSTQVSIDTATNAGLAEQPRCMFEELGSGTQSYRVTGRAVGGSTQTVVMLQATYSTE